MVDVLNSEGEIAAFMRAHPATLLYFSGDDCSVCRALFPKVEGLLNERFPRIGLGRINCGENAELAARHGVFAVPTVVMFFDGRESQRLSRNFSLAQLGEALERPYRLLFE